MSKRPLRLRHGTTFVYLMIVMTALMGAMSMTMDWGRTQVAKAELRNAADAAARYGAQGLSAGTASSNAIAVAAQNTVDATPLVLQSGDVQTGTWNSASKTFTAGGSSPNAVRIAAERSYARGTAIPLLFARVIGRSNCDIHAVSVAMKSNVVVNATVAGNVDPYLAGMPNGTTASYGGNGTPGTPYQHDTAPANVPPETGVSVTGGSVFTFSSTGGTAYYPASPLLSADGDTSTILTHTDGAQNGISSISAPASGLIGVFLDDDAPDSTSAPATLNFSTGASRNFTSLSPQLKQIFYIGNGTNSSGTTQTFTAPSGATRLFLAAMDQYGWLDNLGSLNVTITGTKISLVQ